MPMRGIGKLVENSENNIAVVIKPGIYVEYLLYFTWLHTEIKVTQC